MKMTAIEISLGAIATIATAIATYVALIIKPLQDKIDDLKAQLEKEDRRLSDIEKSYINRVDHAEFRNEIMAAIRDIGNKIDASINGLSHRIETLVERIAKVEANA